MSQGNCRQFIGGEWVEGQGKLHPLLDKYTLEAFSGVAEASPAQLRQAVDAAQAAFEQGAPSGFERGAMLDRAAEGVGARQEDFVRAMVREAGFTRSDAMGEVRRTINTLRLSAEEARRLTGDVIPMDGVQGQSGRIAFTLRVPLGVVLAITPFNSPLNTVTHKLGPALAAGNAVILKPSLHTPLTACLLAQVLADAGVPRGWLSVVHGGGDVVRLLQEDQRIRFFAFTGSTEVGRVIHQQAGLRRTQMELGSIAFTILCDDANLDAALPKVVGAAYRKAGQVCTSIQLLLVHEKIAPVVERKLAEQVRALRYGNPADEATEIGPVITEEAARRVEAWVEEAVAGGARKLAGGPRAGAVVPPTLLAGIRDDMRVGCSEIFGPVMSILPFGSLDEAIARVNATPYGLATGIFTNRLGDALRAARKLQVGGVHINETSSSRVDVMPYGGSKDSGFGREGPRYAVHEMTEERVVSITA
ncbi:aldehyde dehydrogenase family protein [Ramlibacter sp.]|uniref:aldehyde dehydrogenase family protein n=1 Tax=Ramlibacter sp. TaxID=1917967 RepID=UPI002FC6F27A